MKTDFPDDDEDLEALRLAALSSLKKKNESNEFGHAQTQHFNKDKYNNFNKGPFRGGKRRYFPGQSGRNNRNGQFNNVARNSNLISIPTSTDEEDTSIQLGSKFAKVDEVPKFIRPQDRYANSNEEQIESEVSSKFDRYNNSNSESEEEDEISSGNLERSDSLEALMEELDAEIQGESIIRDKKEKVKVKKETKSDDVNKKQSTSVIKVENSVNSDGKVNLVDQRTRLDDKSEESSPVLSSVSDSKLSEVKQENRRSFDPILNKQKSQHSPGQRKIPNRRINNRVFNPDPNFISNTPLLVTNPPFVNPLPPPPFTPVYNAVPPFAGPEVFPINVPPPTYLPPPGLPPNVIPPTSYSVPPIHPLVIEPLPSLQTISMGPLSPRSAAFVLQNRAIVEKRKRSPRRSFSRSPSPPSHRLRYSKSPSRRSLSPLRRSQTPLRRSFSPTRRSGSPRRSPIRRSLSPYRRHREVSPRRDSPRRSPPRKLRDSPKSSPKSARDSPKRTRDRRTPIKDRLGSRNKSDEKDSKNKEESTFPLPKKEEAKILDPVLEARKKKFECKEIKVVEGVIRLKPKEEKVQQMKEDKNVTKTQTELTRQVEQPIKKLKEENVEKSKEEINKSRPKEDSSIRIVLLPKNEEQNFSHSPKHDQLEEAMNELEMLLKDEEALELTAKVDDLFTDEETDQENEMKALNDEKTISTFKKVNNGPTSKSVVDKKRDTRSKWSFEDTKKDQKVKKMKKEPLTNPIENRKIEIKIRNPAKYEKNGSKIQSTNQGRKIELFKKEVLSEDESEPEIVVENEDDDADVGEVPASREGDLRAQLSRKRAERQNKLPVVEGIQSRLLQNALEGAVFKKKKSKRKDKDLKDVKLPIHLRLGIAHDSDIFAEAATEKITRKKSKKRKHTSLEQV